MIECDRVEWNWIELNVPGEVGDGVVVAERGSFLGFGAEIFRPESMRTGHFGARV